LSLDNDSKLFQYIVQPGDTFGGLVNRYQVSSESIQAANPGVDLQNMQVGAAIAIPTDPAVAIRQTGPSRRPQSGPSHRPEQGPEHGPGRAPERRPRRGPEFYRPGRPYYRPYRPYRPYYPEPAYPYPACPVGVRPYAIQPGDTLYTISDRFGISPEEIVTNNPYINFQIPLPAGEFICLPIA
jgi:LysM repeat protein